MLCYTGATTQVSLQHSEPMPTPHVNQTVKPSTAAVPRAGGRDSPHSGQQEGHFFCKLINILIRFLTNILWQF